MTVHHVLPIVNLNHKDTRFFKPWVHVKGFIDSIDVSERMNLYMHLYTPYRTVHLPGFYIDDIEGHQAHPLP